MLINMWFPLLSWAKRSGCSICWYWSIIINNSNSICSNSPCPHCSVNIVLQDQIDDAPVQFTIQIPPLPNQTILAAPSISVITTPYRSQCFLSMNSPMLSSKPTALETKMCGKMMVITSYFKDELHSLKKYNNASNWSIPNCTVKRESPRNRNQRVAL